MKYYSQKHKEDKKALSYLKGRYILDIACGEGRFISLAPGRIIGLDYNPESLDVCRKKGFDARFGKATDLPFKDASFDGVHCSHLIEHLGPDDAYLLLKEIDRVLKVNGFVCIRAPTLHKRFYCNLTHIKPYEPEAIMHYLNAEPQSDRTLPQLPGFYEFVNLEYRRDRLFPFLKPKVGHNNISLFFNNLQRYGIKSLRKTGYMLILRKVSGGGK